MGDPSNQEVQVRFSKGPVFFDTSFKVGFSTIFSIAAPDPGLVEAYVNTVAQAEMQNKQLLQPK